MNDEQIIAEVCRKCGLNFTLGELDALTELCRNYYKNRRFLEVNAPGQYQDWTKLENIEVL